MREGGERREEREREGRGRGIERGSKKDGEEREGVKVEEKGERE